jgi:hypothetical protein
MKTPRSPYPARRPAGPDERGQRGATMVEFAIAGPIAILLILALIQVGLMMNAKQVLNEATFEGARMGASEHGRKKDVERAVKRKLLPFYLDSTGFQTLSDTQRAGRMAGAAMAEIMDVDFSLLSPVLTVKRLSPPDSAFNTFGFNVDDGNGNQVLAIPNDSLEYRTYASQSGLSIQDANEFRIKVVYAYELKVPLMKTVFRSVMCGLDTGVNAFGRGNLDATVVKETANLDCFNYYNQGRVPITSYATVQMQSDGWQDSDWN